MTSYDLDAARSRTAELRLRLAELLRSREDALQVFGRQRWVLEQAAEEAAAKLHQERDSGIQKLKAHQVLDQDQAGVRHARNLARIERGFSNACTRVREKFRGSVDTLAEEERRVRSQAMKHLEGKHQNLAQRAAEGRSGTQKLLDEAEELEQSADRLLSALGIEPTAGGAAPSESTGPEEISLNVPETLESIRNRIVAVRRDPGFRAFRFASPPLIGFLSLIALAIAAAGVWIGSEMSPKLIGAVAGGLWLAILAAAIQLRGRLRLGLADRIRTLSDDMKAALVLLRMLEPPGKSPDRARRDRLVDEKIHLGVVLQQKYADEHEKIREWERTRLKDLARRQADLLERTQALRERKLEEADTRYAIDEMALHERIQAALKLQSRQQAEKMEVLGGQERRELERLGSEWRHLLEVYCGVAAEARRRAVDHHPAWSDPGWNDPKLPTAFPENVYFGDAHVDLKALAGEPEAEKFGAWPGGGKAALPLALSFPGKASLFLSAEPEARARALEVLLGTVMRVAVSFPPGKARFLFIDPVGLGQNFSALMHLADFDEALVSGRIWTEPGHIEKKLSELTEHIEKVIQKYLRNRYATIAEYNPEVGPMAEPYRFLVVADFPSGFTDLGLERLASIVTSGARCGVYTLILHDARQKLPASLPMARIQQGSLVFKSEGDDLSPVDPSLQGSVLGVEPPPTGARLTSLVTAIGRQCADALRVEVPFDVVVPKDDEMWSRSAEQGIRVPLGRAGADRLQHLELGRGTAQHALIAGRTGSGKSTLFHVLITNLALWYGPREVEFYLIDYKKGVEFKTYAVHGLPHARVVSIETDREFGLSVLQRLDRELARRAELFRGAGVQDFASFRREGSARHLPRILLMIDEFQEFFVEEDAISQEAALLLDRIVRQGRAFGVHVILGSQTLGGSYTLAKATLGQMGVRIALQCNEADSYLILSDDNAAARLLSRPGEAIYNDMSGMVEGNNPFQIVWLPDEVQDGYLQRAQDRARREGWLPDEPMTIFEGNEPADIRNNALLRGRIEGPPVPGGAGGNVAWIGEANAIKGPTEVNFRNQGGGNLLLVGQQKEAALGVVVSSVLSLAAALSPKTARFVILNGSPPELGLGTRLEELAKVIPQAVDLVEYARAPEAIVDLDAEVRARQEGSRKAGAPIFLVIYDLQRFRKLRQGDEYEFATGEESKPSPARALANVLAEGPAQGVHSIVWCDSLNSLNRSFTRKSLREFDLRVLFQMSASDSSELIDAPNAAKLGLHRGLLFQEQEGTLEIFRPYGLPEAGWLEEVRRALCGRPLRSA
jgi:hypothetical protein